MTKTREKPTIILGGLAGSGKSTTAELLAETLDLRRVSAGDLFRAMAKEAGMELIEFGRYCEDHPEIDKELDERMMREAEKGGVVLDGRATCYLAKQRELPVLCVWLGVDPRVSAERVAKRDGLTTEEAMKKSAKREREVAERLNELWGVDTKDTSYYDAVIKTDDYTPEEVADLITNMVDYGRN